MQLKVVANFVHTDTPLPKLNVIGRKESCTERIRRSINQAATPLEQRTNSSLLPSYNALNAALSIPYEKPTAIEG